MGFDLDGYETVDTRIHRFYELNPEGRILTALIEATDEVAVFRAEVYTDRRDDRPAATGYARERRDSGFVNETSHVENCETSAIGRALANLGYSTKGSRPSREEMASSQPAPRSTGEIITAAQEMGMPAEMARAVLEEMGYASSSDVPLEKIDEAIARLKVKHLGAGKTV